MGDLKQDGVIVPVGLQLTSCFPFDMRLYVAPCPAFLADAKFQPVSAITYPVNLASQGDFWAQTSGGGLLNGLSPLLVSQAPLYGLQ